MGAVRKGVMAVVGADHIQGIQRGWNTDVEQNLLSEAGMQSLLEVPPASTAVDQELLGAKLGLLARLLELRCGREVTQNALQVSWYYVKLVRRHHFFAEYV